MVFNFNGKNLNIPDVEIKNSMEKLGLSKEDAIQMWLEDNDYLENEEQAELQEKASKVKIDHGASGKVGEKKKAPRTIKVSDEKVTLFDFIVGNLLTKYENVDILKENKLIQVEIDGKIFKIDLIEQRKSKN
ncbi:MAG: hypothetical protein IKT89_04550 [Clostridia bacterium]|nr:hypothetical protein [Clostridia bacterium]